MTVTPPPASRSTTAARRWAPGLVAVLVCASTAGAPRVAGASGFAAAEFGGEHGNVVTTDPTALYFNPSGIALSEGTNLYVSGVAALRRGTWTHAQAASEAADPPGAEGADTGEARFSNVIAAPALAATTWVRRLALGAAFYVPFGGDIHYDSNPRFAGSQTFPLAVDGVQRWHMIDGSTRALYFTVGAAVRVGRLAFGLTGNLIRSSVQIRQAKSFGQAPVDPTNEGRIDIDVAGWQGSVGLGAMVEAVSDRLWFGASYQAQPGLGPMSLTGTLTISDRTGMAAARAISFTQALPDIVRLGARFRPPMVTRALELRAYADLTRWSRLQSQCISLEGQPCLVFADGSDASPAKTTIQNLRRLWNDTYAVNLGASYWITAPIEIFAGVGFATAAVPDATLDPMLQDAASVRFAVGGRFALPRRMHVTAGATDVQYRSRDNTGRSTLADGQLPTRRADGGGVYTLWLGILQVSFEMQF